MSFSNSDLGKRKQWFDAVSLLQQRGDAYALATVLGCTGSTPRDHSSKMVISAEETFDTIGGGHLEHLVTKKARQILSENSETSKTEQEIHHFSLGASLGQCCGGSATVLIETFAACQFHIGIFGAGHVAKSIVTILAGLNCKVSWIDSREDEFPSTIPSNVTKIVSSDPIDELEGLPNGSDVLVLTHNHQLDFDLCLSALKRNRNSLRQLRSIGLIGSETKALRFQKLLTDRLSALSDTLDAEAQVASIRCPVGLSSVPGKLPMEVAVSIVGELIAIDHSSQNIFESNGSVSKADIKTNTKKSRGLAWKDIKQQLNGELDSKGQGTVLRLGKMADVEKFKQELQKK